jgi:hypothetical protein
MGKQGAAMRKLIMSFAVMAMVLFAGAALAEPGEYPGWERGSSFNALYSPEGYESLKGTVEKFYKITPLPGMVEGLGMRMKLRDGTIVDVIVAPYGYVDFLPPVFKPGERAKVKGAWAEVNGRRWFVAAKVRLREVFEVKLRGTRSGLPYWDMDIKELEEVESD